MTATITITDWKPLERNSPRGFLTARLPSGMILRDVAIHTSEGRWWASPASKAQLDKDGQALRDDVGKIKYSPVISFADKATRDKFSAQVLEALKAAHPEVFE
jgi:hypothetical protein